MHPLVLLLLLSAASGGVVQPGVAAQPEAELSAVLRSVTQAQAAYRASHGRYTASLEQLRVRPSPGISVRLQSEGAAGFSAVASSATGECAVFHGGVWAPRPWARVQGRVACRRRR